MDSVKEKILEALVASVIEYKKCLEKGQYGLTGKRLDEIERIASLQMMMANACGKEKNDDK